MHKGFSSPQASHEHSLRVLESLYEHDDFMESVGRVIDLGCGADALDLVWWATRTTRDDTPIPLNISCVGVDTVVDSLAPPAKRAGVHYIKHDLETLAQTKHRYDILWCHDTFQYMINPLGCLANWWNIANPGAMLVLMIPQTTNIEFQRQAFDLPSHCYYNHTVVSLMYMLATTGWDCSSGFFQKHPADPWINIIVYRSGHQPRDPRTTSWYHLAEQGLLPTSAMASLDRYGYVRQRDLLLPWLDKSLAYFGDH